MGDAHKLHPEVIAKTDWASALRDCKQHSMYSLAVSNGSNKFAASARRGPPRQLGLEGYSRDKSTKSHIDKDKKEQEPESPPEMSNPRPTFQYRRGPFINRRQTSSTSPVHCEPTYNENHMDMAQLLMKQWKKVNDSVRNGKEDSYEIYREKERNQDLEDFQPVLEKIRYGTYMNSLGKYTS